MDVLREREVKDSLERQLQDEQKARGEYEKKSRMLCNIVNNLTIYHRVHGKKISALRQPNRYSTMNKYLSVILNTRISHMNGLHTSLQLFEHS